MEGRIATDIGGKRAEIYTYECEDRVYSLNWSVSRCSAPQAAPHTRRWCSLTFACSQVSEYCWRVPEWPHPLTKSDERG